jgi:hypothetical protein
MSPGDQNTKSSEKRLIKTMSIDKASIPAVMKQRYEMLRVMHQGVQNKVVVMKVCEASSADAAVRLCCIPSCAAA